MRYRVIEPFKRGNRVFRGGEIELTADQAQPLIAAGLIAADPVEAPDANPDPPAPVVPAVATAEPATEAPAPAAEVPADHPAEPAAPAPAPAPRRRRSTP